MRDSVSQIVGDPRWRKLAGNTNELAKAEKGLFQSTLTTNPKRKAWYDSLPEDQQTDVREDFSAYLRGKFPNSYPDALATPDNSPPKPSVATSAMVGAAEAGTQTFKSFGDLTGVLGDYGRAIRRNAISLGHAIAGKVAPDWYAEKMTKLRDKNEEAVLRDDRTPWQRLSDQASDYWQNQMDSIQKAFPQGDITKNPELLADPSWWARGVANAATSLSQAYVLGGGKQKAVAAVGSGMEALPEYKQMVKDGMAANDAAGRALAFGAFVGGMEDASLEKMFHGKSPSRIRRALASAFTEGFTEWAEEPAGALAKYLGAKDITLKDAGKRAFQAARQGLNVVPSAALLGGGLAAVSPTDKPNATPQETVPAELAPAQLSTRARILDTNLRHLGVKDEEVIKNFVQESGTAETPEAMEMLRGKIDGYLQKELGMISNPFSKAPPSDNVQPLENVEQNVPTPGKQTDGNVPPAFSQPDGVASGVVGNPVFPIDADEIALKPELMQFKKMDDASAGINEKDKLAGDWDDLKAGNLLLWEPTDPEKYGLSSGERYIVANGHHRAEFANRKNVKTLNAQIVREADGYSASDARRLGAEINIADGKGTVYDQAKFIREQRAALGENEALGTARRAGARGRQAATIGLFAADNLFTSFINEQLTAEQTEIIAETAPDNDSLQRIGIVQAQRGKTGLELANFVKAVMSQAGTKSVDQMDLFGADDSAMREMEDMAKRATSEQSAIINQIRAAQGAAKRPEQAKQLGVSVDNPEAVLSKINDLKGQLDRWKNWPMHPDLVAQVKQPSSVAEEAIPFEEKKDWKAWRQELISRRGPKVVKQFDDMRVKHGVDRAIRFARQALGQQQDMFDKDSYSSFRLIQDTVDQPETIDATMARREAQNQQMTLFETQREFGNVQTTFAFERKTEEGVRNEEIAQQAVRETTDSLRRVWPRLPRKAKIFARAINEAILRRGFVSLKGHRLDTFESVFPLVEVVRNPKYETLRALFVKKGVIVEEVAISSRLPNAVSFGDNDILNTIKDTLAESGAEHVLLYHNHPSGNTTPSTQDIRTHLFLSRELGKVMSGHVVGNHGQFHFIPWGENKAAKFTSKKIRAKPDVLFKSDLPHQALGSKIGNNEDVAELMRSLEDSSGQMILIGRSAGGRTTGLGRLDLNIINSLPRALAALRNFARNVGAGGGVIVANVDPNFFSENDFAFQKAIEANAIVSVVLTDGSAPLQGTVLLNHSNLQFGVNMNSQRFSDDVNPFWPGGELGVPPKAGEPIQDADNPDVHLPIELPELVQLARELTGGKFPKVLRSLPRALGRARIGTKDIELRADIFKLITPEEAQRLRAEAKTWAEKHAEQEDSILKLTEARYDYLYRAAYQAALKKNPTLASKVVAHEIMHIVDSEPGDTVKRGNLFGHIAAFKRYLLTSLAELSTNPDQSIRKEVRRQLHATAAKLTGAKPVGDKAAADLWKKEVKENYDRLVSEYAKKNGYVTINELKAELRPLIAWWRGTQQMEDYFKTPEEMYAEAGSVLLNNPAAVAKRAPKFYKLFFNYIEKRPEFAKEYFAIQDAIKAGTVQMERVRRLREDMTSATELAAATDEAAKKLTTREKVDWFRYGFSRVFGPTLWRVKQISDPKARGAVQQAIGDYLYRKAHHELYLGRVRNEVMSPLLKANLDFVDLMEYMFHQHVIRNRADIANPYGWTAKTSAERLTEMQKQLGDKFKTLEHAQSAFWRVRQEEVIEQIRESGILDEETLTILQTRSFYATIAPVRAQASTEEGFNIDNYLRNSFGNEIGGAIQKQYGFLGDTKNVFLATMQKDLALLNMAYRESSKRAIVEGLINSPFAKEWKEADTVWNGKYQEPKIISGDPRVGTIFYIKGGKVNAWYGPRALTDTFNYDSPIENRIIAAANKYLAQSFTKLWTQLNYGFWPVAYTRDVGGFYMQMPGAKAVGKQSFLEFRKQALSAAKSSLKAEPNDVAKLALRRGELITYPEPMGETNEQPIDALLKSYKLPPITWRESSSAAVGNLNLLRKAWETYRDYGQIRERAVKIAGMLYLDKYHPDMPEFKKREIVREMSGSPDFLSRGKLATWMNILFPLYNPIIRGAEVSVKSAVERPGETAWKMTKMVVLPTLALEALRRGLLGYLTGDDDDELSKMIDAIPRFDLDNYFCFPLGWVDRKQEKVCYARLPMSESQRFVHSLFSKLFRADQEGFSSKNILTLAGGQIPGFNPLGKVGLAWASYKTTGRAPVDPFSGTQLISDDQAITGEGDMALIKWSWNQLGGTVINRFDTTRADDAEPTWVERILRQPIISNSIGRWIKVSNRGVADQYKPITQKIEKERAEIRLMAQSAIKRQVSGQGLTASQRAMYASNAYFRDYLTEKSKEVQIGRLTGPRMDLIMNAKSKQEEAALRAAMSR